MLFTLRKQWFLQLRLSLCIPFLQARTRGWTCCLWRTVSCCRFVSDTSLTPPHYSSPVATSQCFPSLFAPHKESKTCFVLAKSLQTYFSSHVSCVVFVDCDECIGSAAGARPLAAGKVFSPPTTTRVTSV